MLSHGPMHTIFVPRPGSSSPSFSVRGIVYVEPVERGRPTDPIRLIISASTLEIALENSWPLSPATGLRHATRARGQVLRGRSIGVGYVAVVSNYRRFRWIIRAWRRVEEGKYSREVFEGMLDD